MHTIKNRPSNLYLNKICFFFTPITKSVITLKVWFFDLKKCQGENKVLCFANLLHTNQIYSLTKILPKHVALYSNN